MNRSLLGATHGTIPLSPIRDYRTGTHGSAQIDGICEIEGRNRSEFFREAIRIYLASRLSEPQFLIPASEEERKDNPLHTFTEWDSEADSIYDSLR